jgi:hypothetical protein
MRSFDFIDFTDGAVTFFGFIRPPRGTEEELVMSDE